MKKNTGIVIASAACVAALAVGLAVVMSIPSDSKEEITQTSTGDAILLFDKTDLDVEEITVKNDSGEYCLMGYNYESEESSESMEKSTEESTAESSSENSDSGSSDSAAESSAESSAEESSEINMIYTMQDHEKEMLSKQLTDILVNECNYMAAIQIVDQSGKKYSEYGLSSPRAVVTSVFSDNSTIKMYIGNDAPDNKGVYLRMDGDNNVYLVQSSMVDAFFYEKLQMFDRTISVDFDSDYEIAALNVSGTKFEKPIKITNEQNGINNSFYIMTEPYRELCGDSAVTNFGEGMYGLDGTEVAAVEVEEKDMKKYGLDKPYIKAEVTATDGTAAKIIASKADSEGNLYIAQQGATIVYRMNKSDLAWYDTEYSDFLDNTLISPYSENLTAADISYAGKDYHYEFRRETAVNKKYEETVNTFVSCNGTDIDYQNMSSFIFNVSGIKRTSSSPKSLDGCTEIFSIKYTFNVENKTYEDSLKIYTTADKRYAAVLNGHIESYTDGDYIQELLKQVEQVPTSSVISVINTDNQKGAYGEESENQ